MTKRFTRLSQLILALGALGALPAHAQDVVTLQNVPPDLIQEDGATGNVPAAPVDLGESVGSVPVPAAAPAPTGVAQRAAMTARTRKPPPTAAQARHGTERAVFDRQPISVPLPVGAERLITLPAPAALHVPSDMARVARLEVIDKTIYATALVPFTSIRIVAELIDSGQQIPMDLVANATTATARSELEVFAVETPSRSAVATPQAAPAADTAESSEKVAAPDMVELTRHAARQLYAPRRLAWATPGVQQVEVDDKPVPGLMRGANVVTAPLGQWRAGNLYVTAVRVTNLSARSLELPLEDIRGKWLAVTAQHGRIGPAGTETDTTAVYLVCDRAFVACMN